MRRITSVVSRAGKSPRAEIGLSRGPAPAIIRFRFPLVIGWIVVDGYREAQALARVPSDTLHGEMRQIGEGGRLFAPSG